MYLTNCLSVFDHFVGLALKGLKDLLEKQKISCNKLLRKVPLKEPGTSKANAKQKQKNITLFVICSEIPHTQIPHFVAGSHLIRNKSQITCFHKT